MSQKTPLPALLLASAVDNGHIPQIHQHIGQVDLANSLHPKGHPWLVAHLLFNRLEPYLVEVAGILMAHGAPPNRTSHSTHSPLAMALGMGNRDLVGHLLNAGADPDDVDPDGWSALMRLYLRPSTGYFGFGTPAYDDHCVALAKILLKAGANPNLQGFSGVNTALMLAADRGLSGLCQVLIDFGAKVDIRDSSGRRPSDRARLADRAACLEVISEAERVVDAQTDLQVLTPEVAQATRPRPSRL